MHSYIILTWATLAVVVAAIIIAAVWEHYTHKAHVAAAYDMGHTAHALHLVNHTYEGLRQNESNRWDEWWNDVPELGTWAPALCDPSAYWEHYMWTHHSDMMNAEAEFDAWVASVNMAQAMHWTTADIVATPAPGWDDRRSPLNVRMGYLHPSTLNPTALTPSVVW